MRPALYRRARNVALLRAIAFATVSFYVMFFALVSRIGTLAASLGYAAFNLVWLTLCLSCFCRDISLHSIAREG